MKISRIRIKKSFVAFLFMFTLLTMRGMILGNIMGNIGIIVSFVAVISSLSIKRRHTGNIGIIAMCFLFFAYCVLQGILISDQRSFVIYVGVVWGIEVGMAYVVLDDYDTQDIICRWLIGLLVIVVVSYIISFIMAMLTRWETIQIGNLDYNYTYDAPIFFPITLAYGNGRVGNITVYRLLGFARESGIMQCLYIWAYFKIDTFFNSKTKLLKLLMILGVTFCISATGIILFASTVSIDLLTRRMTKIFSWRTFVTVLIVIAAVFLMMSDSEYGFSYRYLFSYQDRRIAIANGFVELSSAPVFGTGFLRKGMSANIQSDICFLSSIGSVGIVGALLFSLTFLQGLRRTENKREFLTSVAPLYITAIIAQPLYYSPLIYLFLFMRTDKCKERQP